ncbi:hypothetical protein BTR23_12860 [Alkalihalophilus pseudofirmus]|nr:hypothetical protein BTR23_12860 [Alkalihalophilus pseudofirmus]
MVLRLLFPIFLIFAVFILLTQSLKLPIFTANGMIGPGFLPMVLALLIIFLLVIEFVSIYWKRQQNENKDGRTISSITISKQVFFMIAVILTLGLVNVIGMLISLGLFIFVILFMMEKRSLINSGVFSLLSIVIIYIIFDVLLGISFPMGMLN